MNTYTPYKFSDNPPKWWIRCPEGGPNEFLHKRFRSESADCVVSSVLEFDSLEDTEMCCENLNWYMNNRQQR